MDSPNEQRKRKPWIPLAAALLVVAIAAGFFMRPFSFYYAYSDLRLWLGGAHSGAVVVHGIRVHYCVAGTREGPAIVLVHGLGGRSENWLPMLPYLTRAGYRVYMIDLPGFGRSDRPQNFSYSMRAQAFIVAQFMNALNLNEADLAGWSMGGWVAQFVAAEHPEHVRRLILVLQRGRRPDSRLEHAAIYARQRRRGAPACCPVDASSALCAGFHRARFPSRLKQGRLDHSSGC